MSWKIHAASPAPSPRQWKYLSPRLPRSLGFNGRRDFLPPRSGDPQNEAFDAVNNHLDEGWAAWSASSPVRDTWRGCSAASTSEISQQARSDEHRIRERAGAKAVEGPGEPPPWSDPSPAPRAPMTYGTQSSGISPRNPSWLPPWQNSSTGPCTVLPALEYVQGYPTGVPTPPPTYPLSRTQQHLVGCVSPRRQPNYSQQSQNINTIGRIPTPDQIRCKQMKCFGEDVDEDADTHLTARELAAYKTKEQEIERLRASPTLQLHCGGPLQKNDVQYYRGLGKEVSERLFSPRFCGTPRRFAPNRCPSPRSRELKHMEQENRARSPMKQNIGEDEEECEDHRNMLSMASRLVHFVS